MRLSMDGLSGNGLVKVARLFWMFPVFEFFLVFSETPPCLLLPAKTLRQLEVFLLLNICAKTSIASGNRLLLYNRFCAILCHFYITLNTFSWGLGLLTQYFFILLSLAILFLSGALFSVSVYFGLRDLGCRSG